MWHFRNEAFNSLEEIISKVIIAIPDSGINPQKDIFINPDGSSRILYLWDQTAGNSAEEGGAVFINDCQDDDVKKTAPIMPPFGILYSGSSLLNCNTRFPMPTDSSGHGSSVAEIAIKELDENSNERQDTPLVIIKLSPGITSGFAKTTSIMYAIDFCGRLSAALNIPVIVNLSYGNNNGCHGGMSLLEQFLRDMTSLYRMSIVVAAGNEGLAPIHATVSPSDFSLTNELSSGNTFSACCELLIGRNEKNLSLTICLSFRDTPEIRIVSPDGESASIIGNYDLLGFKSCIIAVSIISSTPDYMDTKIRLVFISDSSPASGIWRICFSSPAIPFSDINLWLPVSEALNGDTGFLIPSRLTTLTIPSTSASVITVGAFNEATNMPADFSGRGYNTAGQVKPDIIAPGVNVTSAADSTFTLRSGTSFAAPFISGRAAAMISNAGTADRFLYGNRLKSALIREAVPIPSLPLPNPASGWGYITNS